MGFIDAITEGIGNVLLVLIGLLLAFFGLLLLMFSGGRIGLVFIGGIMFVVGLGMAISRYRRQ